MTQYANWLSVAVCEANECTVTVTNHSQMEQHSLINNKYLYFINGFSKAFVSRTNCSGAREYRVTDTCTHTGSVEFPLTVNLSLTLCSFTQAINTDSY